MLCRAQCSPHLWRNWEVTLFLNGCCWLCVTPDCRGMFIFTSWSSLSLPGPSLLLEQHLCSTGAWVIPSDPEAGELG